MFVVCVVGDEHFKEGEKYPVVGTNNGIQIAYTNNEGDGVIELFCGGGIGEGNINNFDGSGKPSFISKEFLMIPPVGIQRNYQITLKIDSDLKNPLKNAAWKNKVSVTEFINQLIRINVK